MNDDEPYIWSGALLNGARTAKVKSSESGYFYIKVYTMTRDLWNEIITFIIEV